jgi:hypothetical protein
MDTLVSKECGSCRKFIRVYKQREKCFGCGGILYLVQEQSTEEKKITKGDSIKIQ